MTECHLVWRGRKRPAANDRKIKNQLEEKRVERLWNDSDKHKILGFGFAAPFVESTLKAGTFFVIQSAPQAQVCDIKIFKVIIWVDLVAPVNAGGCA